MLDLASGGFFEQVADILEKFFDSLITPFLWIWTNVDPRFIALVGILVGVKLVSLIVNFIKELSQ